MVMDSFFLISDFETVDYYSLSNTETVQNCTFVKVVNGVRIVKGSSGIDGDTPALPSLRAVALLELLPRAAWARVVATDAAEIHRTA